MNATLLEETITRLTPDEKLALIGKLWSSLDPSNLPIPPAVLAELDRRRTEYERDPGSALTLDELLARVRRKV
jgi:putative addiction module component (TIGR02574 family)